MSTAPTTSSPSPAAGRAFLRIAIVLVLLAGAAWWFFGRGTAVIVVQAKRGSAAEIVYATGAVEPETWTRVTPLVRGRIVERCRCEGRPVKKGDQLARLDDKEAQATLNDLRAMEEFDRKEFDRQNQLMARGVATAQAFQKAQTELARVQAQVAAQTQRLDYYKLIAPMDGVVLKEDGEIGDMVDPGTILYRIGLPKPLWIVADVNEEDIPRVQLGQKVLLRTDAFAGQSLQGTVKEITPAGDPVAKTFRVRIGLPDDSPLRVGMSVEANIVSREKTDAVLVPAAAISNGMVLVVENGRAHRRKVQTGLRGTRMVEITGGIDERDWIVAPATANIKDGERVNATAQETEQP